MFSNRVDTRKFGIITALVIAITALPLLSGTLASAQNTGACNPNATVILASKGLNSEQANGDSQVLDKSSLSADTRYAAFESWATNLVPADTNNAGDVFVYDRLTCQTTRVSVASDGTQGNNFSGHPSVSVDGRLVAFFSHATNLVAGDNNNTCYNDGPYTAPCTDIFVHDRMTHQTKLVSLTASGIQGNEGSFEPSLSADGHYVAFSSRANNFVSGDTNICYHEFAANRCMDIFRKDLLTGGMLRVSVASEGTQTNDDSWHPMLSGDGRYVAFVSQASNLVSGDTNFVCPNVVNDKIENCDDVFVHDSVTHTTTRVSVADNGDQANNRSALESISFDGRYVYFSSAATNLVIGHTSESTYHFVHDLVTHTTRMLGKKTISDTGSYEVFGSQDSALVSNDTNGFADVFIAKFAYESTSTPTPTAPQLKLQYMTDRPRSTADQLDPFFNIFNTGTVSVPLSELKIRYYFTRDEATTLVYHCDWAKLGCGNITGRLVALSTPVNGANYYLEVGFRSTCGSLAPGAQTGDIQLRVNRTDWRNMNQANDYSFDGTKTHFTDWTKVTLYRNGTLIWGTPPSGAQTTSIQSSSTTPTPQIAPTFQP